MKKFNGTDNDEEALNTFIGKTVCELAFKGLTSAENLPASDVVIVPASEPGKPPMKVYLTVYVPELPPSEKN